MKISEYRDDIIYPLSTAIFDYSQVSCEEERVIAAERLKIKIIAAKEIEVPSRGTDRDRAIRLNLIAKAENCLCCSSGL